MAQPTTRQYALSFIDLVANYALPGVASSIVTAALPKIADIVFGEEEMKAYAAMTGGGGATEENPFSQTIVTQDGKRFKIVVSESETPEVHAALMKLHDRVSGKGSTSSSVDLGSHHQEFYSYRTPIKQAVSPQDAARGLGGDGYVSILNGIIGIGW